MVHALETVHGLLNPGGVILNVHDLAESSPIDVRGDGRDGSVVRVGALGDDSDYALLRYADDALDRVVETGLFAMEARETFAYETHMDSLKTFDDWYGGTWASTTFSAADHQRLASAVNAVRGELTIITHRIARMTRLSLRKWHASSVYLDERT